MASAGRLSLVFDAEIEGIDRSVVHLRSAAGRKTVPYDAVFVMIGSIPPWSVLERAGVRREMSLETLVSGGSGEGVRS
jgi:thioredoxin reductase